jgi:hypothetical protein
MRAAERGQMSEDNRCYVQCNLADRGTKSGAGRRQKAEGRRKPNSQSAIPNQQLFFVCPLPFFKLPKSRLPQQRIATIKQHSAVM